MIEHYNQNYTKEEISIVLEKIKNCVTDNRYTIARNESRQENIDFINEYNLKDNKQKSILLQLNTDDFCHTLLNTKLGYEYEVLYVFVPQVELYNSDGIKEIIDIYTKFNVIDMPYGSRTVVISFHRRNKPIDYLFRVVKN